MLGTIENGVRVVGTIEILIDKYGEKELFKIPTSDIRNTLQQFVLENDAYYYAEEKHKFSTLIAVRLAKRENKKVVVVENMS